MRLATIALLSVFALACGGSIPPPNDEWTAANADVARAQQGGADNVPDAKLHLQLAREDLTKSKDLIDKDNQRAASLIGLSRVEAQLALSLAKAQIAHDQAAQAQADLAKAKGN
jgi:hypothetical protein